LATILLGSACGGPPPSAKRFDLSQALGPVSDHGEPLVVDWDSERRGHLEIAMKQGLAVVHYDPAKIEVLRDCKIEGNYGYSGYSTKQRVVRLADELELKANLPLGGFVGQVSGAFQ